MDSEATENGNNGSGSRVCAPLGLGEIVYLIALIRCDGGGWRMRFTLVIGVNLIIGCVMSILSVIFGS
jgi:hypothetical protein